MAIDLTSLIKPSLLLQLSTLKKELEGIIKRGQTERLRPLLIQFEEEHSELSSFIRTAFTGTPEEVLARLRLYFPFIDLLPDPLAAVTQLQCELQDWWTRPRVKRMKPVDESKRLKP